MAVRQQQRRGTAAQWSGANPILAAAEIGFEIDTNKFKIGDGVNRWNDLIYFTADAAQAIQDLIDGAPGVLDTLNELAASLGDNPDFIGTVTSNLAAKAPINNPTFTGTVAGVTKSMVGLGNVDNTSDANKPISTATQSALDLKADASAITELAQDAVNSALVAGTGLDKTYDDNGNTITIDIDSTVATLTGTQTFTNKTLTSPKINENVALTATATELNILDGVTISTTELNYLDGVVTSIQDQLNDKVSTSGAEAVYAPLASPTLTGTPVAPTAMTGTNTTQIATTAFVKDAIEHIGSLTIVLDGGGV